MYTFTGHSLLPASLSKQLSKCLFCILCPIGSVVLFGFQFFVRGQLSQLGKYSNFEQNVVLFPYLLCYFANVGTLQKRQTIDFEGLKRGFKKGPFLGVYCKKLYK